MRLLFELSGEQPALARAEALASLEALGHRPAVILEERRLLAVETDADPVRLADRVALTHFVDELIAWGSLEDTLRAAEALDFGPRTFRVRVNSLRGCHERLAVEKAVGDRVRGPVDLSSPDEEIRLIEGDLHYLCRRAARVDRSAYEARTVEGRPVNHPISLHPRFARALVNLSRVPPGGTLLDPFCGTGGILLEAALAGARAVGGDIRPDMAEGSRSLLAARGLGGEVRVADVGEMAAHASAVDAVATDPPYGRASSTGGEPLRDLYGRTIAMAARALRPGGHLAIIAPEPGLATPSGGLEPVEAHTLRVHRSLTRHFVVMRRAR